MQSFVQWFAVNLLNGVSVGLLLFMLSAGLTLIFSMLGVLNFAHASFYMLGAYVGLRARRARRILVRVGRRAARRRRRWARCSSGLLLRRVHARGALAELLLTFGAAYLIGEAVKLVWGLAPLAATDSVRRSTVRSSRSTARLSRAIARS